MNWPTDDIPPLNDSTIQAIERERERTRERVLEAIDNVREYYTDINLTTAAEAARRCREAVQKVFEETKPPHPI